MITRRTLEEKSALEASLLAPVVILMQGRHSEATFIEMNYTETAT